MASWGPDNSYTDDQGIRWSMDEVRDIQTNRTIYRVRAYHRGERRIVTDTMDIRSFGDPYAEPVTTQMRYEETPEIDLTWNYEEGRLSRRSPLPTRDEIFRQGMQAIQRKIDAGEHLTTRHERMKELERMEYEEQLAQKRRLEKLRLEEERKAQEREALESMPAYGIF